MFGLTFCRKSSMHIESSTKDIFRLEHGVISESAKGVGQLNASVLTDPISPFFEERQRYPDFEYNARGGGGRGEGKVVNVKQGDGVDEFNEEVILVEFDVEGLFIPPLSYETTKFLGLPLPPFLKIEIVPEVFQGRIEKLSGKVDLEFKAKFWFSIGTIYKAPPLLVVAILTSEESTGEIRNGGGQRLDNAGRCRLVGVATVDPIDDLFMNTFLGLPTECLADMNAAISLDQSA